MALSLTVRTCMREPVTHTFMEGKILYREVKRRKAIFRLISTAIHGQFHRRFCFSAMGTSAD